MNGEAHGEAQENEANAAAQGDQAQAEAYEQVLSESGTAGDSGSEEDGSADGSEAGNGTELGVTDAARAAFEKQLEERDAKIASLEAEVAQAAKSAEKEKELNAHIEELKAQAATERAEFELTLAGCKSVKAGRLLLEEHDGDVDALKEAEPWLFGDSSTQLGATGLPNAGTAASDEAAISHWREIAGLED